MLLAVGESPERTIREFCEAAGCTPPRGLKRTTLAKVEALVWEVHVDESPLRVRTVPPPPIANACTIWVNRSLRRS